MALRPRPIDRCGLLSDDLSNCQQSSRDGKIGCIKRQLRQAMDAPGVSPDPIRDFLRFLSRRTEKGTRHRFLTTNWDYLLQREVSAFAETIGGGPTWLSDSHVFHLNGTVEVLGDNSRRSALVLREDAGRGPSMEFDAALAHLTWGSTFVVVGMAFECLADRALFSILNRVEDELPSGGALWIIVNPCLPDIQTAQALIQKTLPRATVKCVQKTLADSQETDFSELVQKGVFS